MGGRGLFEPVEGDAEDVVMWGLMLVLVCDGVWWRGGVVAWWRGGVDMGVMAWMWARGYGVVALARAGVWWRWPERGCISASK